KSAKNFAAKLRGNARTVVANTNGGLLSISVRLDLDLWFFARVFQRVIEQIANHNFQNRWPRVNNGGLQLQLYGFPCQMISFARQLSRTREQFIHWHFLSVVF